MIFFGYINRSKSLPSIQNGCGGLRIEDKIAFCEHFLDTQHIAPFLMGKRQLLTERFKPSNRKNSIFPANRNKNHITGVYGQTAPVEIPKKRQFNLFNTPPDVPPINSRAFRRRMWFHIGRKSSRYDPPTPAAHALSRYRKNGSA